MICSLILKPRSGQAVGLDDCCRSLPTELFYSVSSKVTNDLGVEHGSCWPSTQVHFSQRLVAFA